MGDPWSDLKPVSHKECVVVMRANVTEGDGIWLLSASSHSEDLVALWVVEKVLIPSCVWHEE